MASAQPPRPCLQAVDGALVARVQSEAQDSISRVKADPAYGGAWYEHSPCYPLVLAFTDDRPRPWVIEAAPAHLRPYLGFARTRFSQAEREAAGEQIRTALLARGVHFTFSTSARPKAFLVGVRTEAEARTARSLIPRRYRSITGWPGTLRAAGAGALGGQPFSRTVGTEFCVSGTTMWWRTWMAS